MKQKKATQDEDEGSSGKKQKKKVKVPGKKREKYKGTYRDATERNTIRKVKRMLKSCGPYETVKAINQVHKPREGKKGKNIKALPYMSPQDLEALSRRGGKFGMLATEALKFGK